MKFTLRKAFAGDSQAQIDCFGSGIKYKTCQIIIYHLNRDTKFYCNFNLWKQCFIITCNLHLDFIHITV